MDIRQNIVFLLLTTSALGNSRRVSNKADYLEPSGIDPSMVSMSHKLLDCEELQAIRRHEATFREWLLSIDVSPRSVIRAGIYGLSMVKIEEVNYRLGEFVQRREQLVKALAAVYTTRVEEAKARLGPQFDPADYLPADAGIAHIEQVLAREFAVTYQYLEFSTPTRLSGVSQAMFEAERERAAEMWAGITEQMETALFVEVQSRLEKLLSTLKTGRVQQRTWDKAKVFVDEFASWRNVTNNQELQALITRTRQLFADVPNAETIRSYAPLNTAIQEGVTQLQQEITTLIAQRPQRIIRFTIGASENGTTPAEETTHGTTSFDNAS